MTRSEREKMIAGDVYAPGDAELVAEQASAKAWMIRYNAALADSPTARRDLLKERLGSVGEGVVIRPPFHCDYGWNLFVADGVFMNFGCVVLDVAPVRIGTRTQIGPGGQLLAADHPRDAALRAQGIENGRPVHIGSDVWIGGGALILPGVTIGDGAIIGAGAVVTRDVAPGATAVGNPARSLPSA